MNWRQIAKFWSQVRVGEAHECWEWLGTRDDEGYGRGGGEGEVLAHRFAWRASGGELESGDEVDHTCSNRGCENPGHLRRVGVGFNLAQGAARSAEKRRAQTHCWRGHPLSGENLRLNPRGQRVCKACARQTLQEWRARCRK